MKIYEDNTILVFEFIKYQGLESLAAALPEIFQYPLAKTVSIYYPQTFYNGLSG